MEETLNRILQELSTLKNNIGSVRTELKEEMWSVRTELTEQIGNVRTELKEEIGSVRTELKEEIGSVRTELKEEIGSVRTELKGEITELKEGQERLEKKLISIPESYENLEVFIDRQQRTMEKLSERSIRHEADIQSLRSTRF
ncbi:hypothetical protein [Salibacterium aidingense]|uniref:hypothetical protein n=1 Tax=Salibacterium aidingense TaxID=384933 RepID=UPI003BBA2BEC